MIVKGFAVGWLSTNCYVVGCEETREAAVIDPGMESEREAEPIMDFIKQNSLQIKYIINTHGHPDHVAGNTITKEATGAPILIHESNSEHVQADRKLHNGDAIQVGTLKLVVLHTPGHTKDGISLLGDNAVFTGDTLFAGSVGRTDFLGGSYEELMQSIKTKLLPLPDSLKVYPGHGPATTIGNEKRHNPFLQT
ncbi:MAG: MBL fold metallo-hydrolase [Candidatus Bathyarchaeota archaeon]|jgi:glyoxylase-like metal-dependent hydrolase (beta-lactamase superfamily II)